MEDDQVQLELDETGKSEEWYRVGGKAGGRIRRLRGYHYTTLHWGYRECFWHIRVCVQVSDTRPWC